MKISEIRKILLKRGFKVSKLNRNKINKDLKNMVDLNKSELIILSSLALPSLYFGFYPEPLISTVEMSVSNLINNYNSSLEIYLANKK